MDVDKQLRTKTKEIFIYENIKTQQQVDIVLNLYKMLNKNKNIKNEF